MKHYETILTETVGEHLLKVTLNRPEVGNAKNTQMGLDLLDLWTSLIDDPGAIRCVILTGAGEADLLCRRRSEAAPRSEPETMAAPARNLRARTRCIAGMSGASDCRDQWPRLRRRAGDRVGL
jgi:enoyl-CoA hydratase/carnithine racemase